MCFINLRIIGDLYNEPIEQDHDFNIIPANVSSKSYWTINCLKINILLQRFVDPFGVVVFRFYSSSETSTFSCWLRLCAGYVDILLKKIQLKILFD